MDSYSPTATWHDGPHDLPADDDKPKATIVFQPQFAKLFDNVTLLRSLTAHAAANAYLPLIACVTPQGDGVNAQWYYDDITDDSGWIQGNVTQNLYLLAELDLARFPVGTQLTAVGVNLEGGYNGATHAALTQFPPSVQLMSVDGNGVTNAETSAVVDGSATHAAYDALHSITVGPFAVTVAANTRYYVRIKGEAGTNAAIGKLAIRSVLIAKNGP